MIKILIVNGAPGSGKTTMENFCKAVLGEAFCQTRSTIDKVKEIAMFLGWDGMKDLAGRRFLSDLKDAFTRYNDMPLNDIKITARLFSDDLEAYGINSERGLLMVDCREPEEIQKLVDEFNAKTVLVVRPEVSENEVSNHADEFVNNYEYDFCIYNNGTLEDLEYKARQMLIDLGYDIEI